MSRKRMLSPDIWTDEGFLSLRWGARLLFTGMFSHADDEGRGSGCVQSLKAKIFPGDNLTPEFMQTLCDEVAAHMRVRFYEVEGVRCYQMDRWDKHQFVKDAKPSTIPPPTGSGPTPDRERTDAGPGPVPNERKKEKKEKKEYAPAALVSTQPVDKSEMAPKVKLTPEEHAKLVTEYGASLTSEAIQFLADYKADKPYRNKSDYLTIRRWVIQAVQDRRRKAGGAGPPRPGVVEFKGRKCPQCGKVQTTSAGMCLDCGEELPRRT